MHFLITVVFLSSLGVWLPFAIDKAKVDSIAYETWIDLPTNLITYGVAIMMVSYVDRLLFLINNTTKYKRNGIEFLILLIIIIATGFLIFIAYVDLKFGRILSAIKATSLFTLIALATWIYVKAKNPRAGNFSSIGGPMS
ncbi:hypothetical protein SAMN05660226_02329 [Parapedobacter luteus]|uniref:Uncharacterized protein n=2 Tax=Parapedobacter luteus TaxID=623280 RepID=A0A1T5CU62_9SPHI|nr:hypothetical protein SAMN05660226_02329 [Parapedobacter luteus]